MKVRTPAQRFSTNILDAIRGAQVVGIRAGRKRHRVIAVWVVVVRNRVFVRSWSLSPNGWFHKFLIDPTGLLTVGSRRIPVSAIHIRSDALKREVSRAYADKYTTPGSSRFVKDLSRKRCRDATIELQPRKRAAA